MRLAWLAVLVSGAFAVAMRAHEERAEPMVFYKTRPHCATAQEVLIPYVGPLWTTAHIKAWVCK